MRLQNTAAPKAKILYYAKDVKRGLGEECDEMKAHIEKEVQAFIDYVESCPEDSMVDIREFHNQIVDFIKRMCVDFTGRIETIVKDVETNVIGELLVEGKDPKNFTEQEGK